ncbi:MAG: sensor histidine kinase [Psychroflexus salarius]
MFKRSLSTRIFLSMIALVIGASVLIAIVTVYQYKQEAEDLHREKLNRKENAIRANINYILRTTYYTVNTENLPLIFKEKIYEIQDIHDTEINIYDTQGHLLKSSMTKFYLDSLSTQMPEKALTTLQNSSDKKYVNSFVEDNQKYQSSYTYILDKYFKPIGILNLPYIEDDGFLERELNDFLILLAQVYALMLIAAMVLAYFQSNYITRSLKAISQTLNQTRLDQKNPKIKADRLSSEIKPLIHSYNAMVDQLEESAAKLAKSERDEAWRQMAKQVAHEIKNPLTPMRLNIQNFERRFKADDPDITTKLKDFSSSLIQQIDTLSTIASAFSDFAQMPAQKSETINLVETTKLAIDIFNANYIQLTTNQSEIDLKFDKTQWIRIITNLLKNAIQATSEQSEPEILVEVTELEKTVKISVQDNGCGISEDHQQHIFEPKFTTKSSGMGLGLGMVKNLVENYKGSIKLTSKLNQGSTFVISIPKN